MPGLVRVEEQKGVTLIVLARPEKLNALSTALLGELVEAVRSAGDRPILLTGQGRVFSAGVDLEEVASARSPEEVARPFHALGDALRALINHPAPTLTYLNGPAIAGGAELALATDLIIMGRASRLEWPEARWNLVAPLLTGLAARTGSPRLAAAALAGARITSSDAVNLGLASAIIDEGLPEALEYAARVAELYAANRESYAEMLGPLREWKRRSLAEMMPRLEGLAARMELAERARRFLERRR